MASPRAWSKGLPCATLTPVWANAVPIVVAYGIAAPVITPELTRDCPSAEPIPGRKYAAAKPTMAGAFLESPRDESRSASAVSKKLLPALTGVYVPV